MKTHWRSTFGRGLNRQNSKSVDFLLSLDEVEEVDEMTRSPHNDSVRSGLDTVVLREPPQPPSVVYLVCHNYDKQEEDELSLTEGHYVRVLKSDTGENKWFYGESSDGTKGMFPANFVRRVDTDAMIIPPKDLYMDIDEGDMELNGEKASKAILGQGAEAVVYRILYDGKPAALKRPKRQEQFTQVRNEAAAIRKLDHRNIVKLYGVCHDKPYRGLVLELCEGGSLTSLYSNEHIKSVKMPLRILLNWAKQIADGMAYLSSQGLVHRDLKAENVLVDRMVCCCGMESAPFYNPTKSIKLKSTGKYREDGSCIRCNNYQLDKLVLKVADFGTTKAIQRDRMSVANGTGVGTLAWMAPEVFKVQQYSEKSDVYSYGVVLWELINREPPNQEYTIAIAQKFKNLELQMQESWPAIWTKLIYDCTNLDPEKRPTFHQISRQLFELLSRNDMDQVDDCEVATQLNKFYTNPKFSKNGRHGNNQEDIYQFFQTLTNNYTRAVPPEKPSPHKKHRRPNKNDISSPCNPVHLTNIGSDMVVSRYPNDKMSTLPRKWRIQQQNGFDNANGSVASSSMNYSSWMSQPDLTLDAAIPLRDGLKRTNGIKERHRISREESRDNPNHPTVEIVSPTESNTDRPPEKQHGTIGKFFRFLKIKSDKDKPATVRSSRHSEGNVNAVLNGITANGTRGPTGPFAPIASPHSRPHISGVFTQTPQTRSFQKASSPANCLAPPAHISRTSRSSTASSDLDAPFPPQPQTDSPYLRLHSNNVTYGSQDESSNSRNGYSSLAETAPPPKASLTSVLSSEIPVEDTSSLYESLGGQPSASAEPPHHQYQIFNGIYKLNDRVTNNNLSNGRGIVLDMTPPQMQAPAPPPQIMAPSLPRR